jgi:molybdopterin converting factor small subunit
MPTVTLTVTRWLRETLNLEPTDSGAITVAVPEGETILGLVQRLAAEHEALWQPLADAGGQHLHPEVLVICNGRIVNPYDRGEAILHDGDEVMFLPAFAGG